jgi:L-threonylcarbamoyladenylate synthase
MAALKARREHRPVPLFATPATAGRFAFVSADAARAMEFAWPGGVSFVLKRRPNVPEFVTGSGAVMLVCPDPWSVELGERAGFPIAATSANASGEPPCLAAEEAFARFGKDVNLIVDGGRSAIGLPTTIVDWTGEPRVVRAGAEDPARLRRWIPALRETPP